MCNGNGPQLIYTHDTARIRSVTTLKSGGRHMGWVAAEVNPTWAAIIIDAVTLALGDTRDDPDMWSLQNDLTDRLQALGFKNWFDKDQEEEKHA